MNKEMNGIERIASRGSDLRLCWSNEKKRLRSEGRLGIMSPRHAVVPLIELSQSRELQLATTAGIGKAAVINDKRATHICTRPLAPCLLIHLTVSIAS